MPTPLQIVEALGGTLVTVATLADIFATILVPGPTQGGLRIGTRLREAMAPAARAVARRRSGGGGNVFAPLLFVLVFATWMALLLVGFGLLFLAAADYFTPALSGFDDALNFAGCSLLTLGVSEVDAHGPARWLLLAAGLSGFGVITATLTFVVQVQGALHQRESRVLTLGSLAGTPPSGIQLLEAIAQLGVAGELHDFFRIWRDWAAAMLHSHMASPMLIFFRSVDRESDWLQALEAVLDGATMLMALTTHEASGAATLMHRTGSRTAARLCALLDAEPQAAPVLNEAAVKALIERLAGCGYETVQANAATLDRFASLRADYAGRVGALVAELRPDRR